MPRRETTPGTRRPSERRLSEVARKVVMPDGIASTGWGDIERQCEAMGVPFDEWQRGAGRLIMARRKDGSLAATVSGVGMSLPRQVGKTYLLSGLAFALCASRPGTLLIWTAQHLATSSETFLAMQGFAQAPKVAPFIQRVYTGSGDEEVRFINGSRILFGARERGFGRGIPGVDAIIFDEAQHLSERAMDAMLATMNTSELGMHLYIGTPPRPEDNSEAFTQMRKEAWAGELEDGVWIECGADPDADPHDRKQWAKANPSYPHRTGPNAFRRLAKKLTPESFMREALGVWAAAGADVDLVIPSELQAAAGRQVRDVDPDWPLACIALDMDAEGRTYTALAVHGPDALVHVELLGYDLLDGGSSQAVEWIKKRARRRMPVVMPGDSPVTVLEAPLRGAGVKTFRLSAPEDAQAATGLVQGLRDKELSWLAADEVLASEVTTAERDPLPRKPGQWRIKRQGPTAAAPLRAVACARLGAVKWARRRQSSGGATFV